MTTGNTILGIPEKEIISACIGGLLISISSSLHLWT